MFGSAIELAPLQVYGSLLFFSPVASKTREMFWHGRIPERGQVQGVKSDWGARRQTVSSSDTDMITAIAFSPDGNLLAFASETNYYNYKVKLYNPIAGTDLRTLDGHYCSVIAMAFSPDGLYLVLGCRYGRLLIWNVTTVKLEHEIPACANRIRAVSFSDTTHFLSISSNGRLAVWDASTGECEKETDIFESLEELSQAEKLNEEVFCATFSLCMKLIAWKGEAIYLLNLAGDPCPRKLRDQPIMPGIDVTGLAFSPDSKTIASAWEDGTVHLWDVKTGALLHLWDGKPLRYWDRHLSVGNAVTFSPDGQLLASASRWGTHLWNVETRTCRASFPNRGYALDFSPDSQTLASGFRDVQLWDTTLDQQTGPSDSHDKGVTSMSLSSDGRLIASASLDRTIHIRDASTGTRKWLLQNPAKDPSRLLFSPDDGRLACSSTYGTLSVWNVRSGALQKTISGYGDSASIVEYSPDGQLIAWAPNLYDCQVQLWQVATRKLLRAVDVRKERREFGVVGPKICSLTFSPDSRILAVISFHYGHKLGELLLWETSTGTQSQVFSARLAVTQIVFQANGHLMALFGDKEVLISENTSCSVIHRIRYDANAICFSPDNRLIALAGATVELWDVATGTRLHTLVGHKGHANTISFSPSSELVAVASDDTYVRLWTIAANPSQHAVLSHRDVITMIEFSLDGQVVATSSQRGFIWLWDVVSGSRFQTVSCTEGFIRRITFQPDELVVSLSNSSSDCFWNVWDDMGLKTHRYCIIDVTRGIPEDPALLGIGIDTALEWITKDSTRLLWIPEEYRPTLRSKWDSIWVKQESTIFIGCRSGNVIRFQLT